jgi:hypothetical protein
MHNALNVVNQMMNLTFDNRFEISLEFTACNLRINTQRQCVTFFEITDIRADDLNLTVLDSVHLGHLAKLGALALATTRLAEKIGTPYPLALIGRAE